jgi:hypothetical protein
MSGPENYGGSRRLLGTLLALRRNVRERVLKLTGGRLPMANSSLIETLRGTAAANRFQIATLIESLLRSVELLTVDIEHEETRAGVRDLSDPTYPVLARSLRSRRDNIRATLASLGALVPASEAA